jgi:predicted ATPase
MARRREPAAALSTSAQFILEREHEVAMVDSLIEAASAGSGRLAAIEGPAGIGKTRLLAEARARAAVAGCLVLGAQASELEREFAFGVVRQLFESAVSGSVLSGAAAPAGAIVGEQAQLSVEGPVGEPSFASLHGLYWLTIHLSEERPLLIAVDDLQWCDASSLRFLAYLRGRLEDLPVLLMCAVRSADPGPTPALVGAIVSDPSTVQIRPRPLSDGAAAALIERRLGEPARRRVREGLSSCHGGQPAPVERVAQDACG